MTLSHFTVGLLFLAISVTTSFGAGNLNWNNHYDKAKKTAQAAKRPLVVVIEDSGTDQKLDEESLSTDSKRILLQEDFELVRVDANTDYGKRVALAFGAKQLPYTAVTDERSERIVYRKAGRMSKSDWTLALAQSVKTQGQPEILSEGTVIASNPVQPISVAPQMQSYVQPASYTSAVPQPVMTYKPIISNQTFVPYGMYSFPTGAQCFT